jgi:hypothetical protein
MVPNAPKWKETHQNMSLDSNGGDWECLLQKFLTRNRGTNFCINCTSLAHFASSLCNSIMVPNAPKRKETLENMSLGSNCVDRERRFREILARLCGTNSCINCTRLANLHRVSCSSETVPNAPKHKETHQKISLGSNGVDWERSLQKILTRHRGTNFCINWTSLARLQLLSCNSETVPNAPNRKETHQNMSLGSNGVDRESSFWKILIGHRWTNFCINCTSLARFAPSFVQ